MRLINADNLIEELSLCGAFAFQGSSGLRFIMELVDVQPTVDAEPVVHAYWIPGKLENSWKCSRCGYYHFGYPHKRCDGCDAKMDGDEEK